MVQDNMAKGRKSIRKAATLARNVAKVRILIQVTPEAVLFYLVKLGVRMLFR